MRSIDARVPDETADELAAVAELLEEDEQTVVRRALREGVAEIRIQYAIDQYRTGDVSINQAARIADVSLAEWLEVASENDLTSTLDEEALEADAKVAREL